jgi:peroxiredoxin
MAETNTSGVPGQADLQNWANGYGLTFPILSDPNWQVCNGFEVDNYIPSYTLIDREMKLVIRDGYPSASIIASELAEPWPEL